MRYIAFALALIACSSSEQTPPKQWQPPKVQPSPKPGPTVCEKAVMNLIRVGCFRLAQVPPPHPSNWPLVCEIFEEKGYDLKCIGEAESCLAVSYCKYKCNPNGDGCR